MGSKGLGVGGEIFRGGVWVFWGGGVAPWPAREPQKAALATSLNI